MNNILITILLSISPISELRGGMPYAIAVAKLPVLNAFLISVISNIAIIAVIFLFLDFLHKHLHKIVLYKKVFDSLVAYVRKKSSQLESQINRYGFLALIVFVAIPLPVTGAWTGSLIAWLLNLDRKKSLLAIALGVIISGVIVLLATLGVINAAIFLKK